MRMGTAVAIALLVGIAIGVVAIYLLQQNRTRHLKEHFGPEYTRVMEQTGSRSAAEAKLEGRQRRVARLHIRQLDSSERMQFQESWRDVQAHFVDDPSTAVTEADQIIGQVMSAEGYPMREFEERAADISVDHPVVTEHYREA